MGRRTPILWAATALLIAFPLATTQPIMTTAQGGSPLDEGFEYAYAFAIVDGVEIRVTSGQVLGKGVLSPDGTGCIWPKNIGKYGTRVKEKPGAKASYSSISLASTTDCTIYVK